jgi:hypothetical protein
MRPHLPITRPAAAVFSARGRSDDTTRPAWATCFALLCRLRLSWPAGPWRGRRPGKAHHVACYLSILHHLVPAGACRFGAPGQSRRASFSPGESDAACVLCLVGVELGLGGKRRQAIVHGRSALIPDERLAHWIAPSGRTHGGYTHTGWELPAEGGTPASAGAGDGGGEE